MIFPTKLIILLDFLKKINFHIFDCQKLSVFVSACFFDINFLRLSIFLYRLSCFTKRYLRPFGDFCIVGASA